MPSFKLWRHPDNRRWYIVWSEGRRSRRVTTGTAERGKAEIALATFILEASKPQERDASDVIVAHALDRYYTRHGSALPSAHQARIAIADLKDFYGKASVAGINTASHDLYRQRCIDKGLSPSSINRRRAVLRAALKDAVKRQELKSAPFVPAEPEPPPRADALTREQVAALLRAARHEHPHVALFIRLAVYTGARRQAILQLTWDRVDLSTGVVDFRLPGVVHRRKRRAVTALPAKLVSTLRRRKAKARGTNVISRHGKPVGSIKRAFRTVAKAAGLPWVTPHVFKHTAVTWALRVVSPWMVEGMTATSLRTLQRVYGKHMAADLREAADAVAHNRVRKSRANDMLATDHKSVVGATGIEPVTPTMSRKRAYAKRRK